MPPPSAAPLARCGLRSPPMNFHSPSRRNCRADADSALVSSALLKRACGAVVGHTELGASSATRVQAAAWTSERAGQIPRRRENSTAGRVEVIKDPLSRSCPPRSSSLQIP
jgi:hypothetical protein